MTDFNPKKFRRQFPLIMENKGSLVYFDNAATTQKPQQVISSEVDYYTQLNANVHRSSHQLSTKATIAFEQTRKLAQKFLGTKDEKEIVWTSGATESINIITQCLARSTLTLGDEIVLSASEHHANIVPWQIVAEQTGAKIKILPISKTGIIDVKELDNVITEKTKFVACAHVSNVIGKLNPIEKIINKAKSVGAITVIDGAQAVAHFHINVQLLDCDFYVFSAHKMFGPTGVGVLYGQMTLLESMPPYKGGGEMIETVSFTQGTTYNTLPFKFEAGTPNIAGVIALGEAIKFLMPLLADSAYSAYEKSLLVYCYQSLAKLNDINFIVEDLPDIGVISFTVKGHHNQDISSSLDQYGIAIRAGHHCAMPLMDALNLTGCLRVSIAAYNTFEEVDLFIQCLKSVLVEIPFDAQSITAVQKNAMPISNDMEAMITRFINIKGWDSRHREIMLLGKTLTRLDKSLRSEDTLITGCESLAWLHASQNQEGVYIITADSDAKIIRGLLVIVLSAYNNKTAEQIRDINIHSFFEELGLLKHLSPSRGNGLLSIVEKIEKLVI